MINAPNALSVYVQISEMLIRETQLAGLRVMTAGPMPPSPLDLLMGPKLLRMLDKVTEMGYDHVVIDAPPILGIADAIVLGNQVQNIVFAIKASATRLNTAAIPRPRNTTPKFLNTRCALVPGISA